jgi:hypothetical protein
MLRTYVDYPITVSPFFLDSDLYDWLKNDVESEWNGHYIEKHCHMCDGAMFVKVEPMLKPKPSLLVLAAKCAHCGLDIKEEERFLAEYHVSELSAQDVKNLFHTH